MKKISYLIKKLSLSKNKFSVVYSYFLGNFRYRLYYYRRYKENFNSPLMFFMRGHIAEQIEYRIYWMDIECYDKGECKICGCATTALQMCNKSCEKPCYPDMMSRWQWKRYKKGSSFRDHNGIWLALLTQNNKPVLFKETNYGFTPQMDIKNLPNEENHIQQDFSARKY